MLFKQIGDQAYRYRYSIFFIFIGFIYCCNLFIQVMDIDAAQYASLAREMLENGNFLHVYLRGEDYLDKPPLLFWLASASYALWGVSTLAYKLPAVLVLVLGIYATYRFTQSWYDEKRARLAALILATTQALMLITNDIRTDGILTGFSIFTVWQLGEFLQNGKFKHILVGSVGLGLAMLSKGPIGLILPGAAIGSHILLTRSWEHILKWQWIALFVFVAILLVPMSYGLYTQFDLHPEKQVFDMQGPSGLKFFYWDQSFGRVTGSNTRWDNGAPFTYFMHTILWDFQPWVLFLILSLFTRIKNILWNRFRSPDKQEQFTLGGFILVFLALSGSSFKLPHYIFPIFPFAAIFVADYLFSLSEKGSKYLSWLKNIQFGLLHILFIMVGISLSLFFPAKSIVLPTFVLAMFVLFYISFFKVKELLEKLIVITLVANLTINVVMALNFYPNLLKYQPGGQVGKEILAKNVPQDKFYALLVGSFSLDFYSQRTVPYVQAKDTPQLESGTYLLTNDQGLEDMGTETQNWTKLKTYPHYHITGLRPQFLYSKTREEAIDYQYLLVKK